MINSPIHISESGVPIATGATYQDVIRRLCQETASANCPEYADEMFCSALERETQEPTYVGRGLAIPHARVAGLGRAYINIARSQGGILWPEEAATTIVLLAVPAEQPDLYLQLLRRIVQWRMKGEPCPLAEFIGKAS